MCSIWFAEQQSRATELPHRRAHFAIPCPRRPQARNRLIALKSAQAAAAIFKTESLSGRSVEQSEEASAHGGRRAFELLTAMSSLRRINRTSLEEILEEVQSGHGDENGENGGDTAANAASTGGNHASSNHVSGKQQGNNGGSSEVPNGRGGGAAAAAGIV